MSLLSKLLIGQGMREILPAVKIPATVQDTVNAAVLIASELHPVVTAQSPIRSKEGFARGILIPTLQLAWLLADDLGNFALPLHLSPGTL